MFYNQGHQIRGRVRKSASKHEVKGELTSESGRDADGIRFHSSKSSPRALGAGSSGSGCSGFSSVRGGSAAPAVLGCLNGFLADVEVLTAAKARPRREFEASA